MSKIFSKENLTQVGGLGLGATAAKVLEKKVINKIMPESMAGYTDLAASIIPIFAGIFFPTLVKGNLGRGIGDGMVAAGSAKLVEKLLTTAGAGDLITGTDTMMAGIDTNATAGSAFLGSTGGSYDTYQSSAAESAY